MPANNDDFMTVFRGQSHYWDNKLPEKESDLRGLGIHWTTDPRIAGHFAAGENDPDYEADDEHPKSSLDSGGYVITARVPKSGIIDRRSDEFKEIANNHGIMYEEERPDYNPEKEVTVRPGTPVDVHDITVVESTSARGGKSTEENAAPGFAGFKVLRQAEFNQGKGTA